MTELFNIPNAQVFVLADLCATYGLRKVVISPGSRNAPLTFAFHHHPQIECYNIPDERSAGYFALGIAQHTKAPVGVICTSGTAALNLTPAIAEAYYQKIPLVAITADRPTEWLDQLDGQTINQSGIYQNFTGYQGQIPVGIFSDNELWHLQSIIRDAFHSIHSQNIPVHLNVPLREPLYNLNLPKLPRIQAITPASKDIVVHIPDTSGFKKILMIHGMQRPDAIISKYIETISSKGNVVILAENVSNVGYEQIFNTSDALISAIANNQINEAKPDLVITFGDMLLSKPLKQWLRSVKSFEHWIVTDSPKVPDVLMHIDKIFRTSKRNFLKAFANVEFKHSSGFVALWKRLDEVKDKISSDYAEKVAFSDFKVFEKLSKNIPTDSIVHLGNSSPVRYAQFFKWKKGIEFYCNRGTAGIDGCTSTALGVAVSTTKVVTLITGDVSFLYDSNAMWNKYKRNNFKIILINNKGGNIFSLIPGPSSTGLLDEYFKTNIPVSIEHLAKAYGYGYLKATEANELEQKIKSLYADSQIPAILEIETEPEINTKVWKEYFAIIKSKLL